jgi:uncharacterized repeat protein (TIGR01451 family)
LLVGELARVKGADFEAVDVGSLMISADSGQARGAGPVGADLKLSVSDSPDPIAFDTRLTYTVTVHNSGPEAATRIVVTDTLASECSLSSVSTQFGTYSQSGNELTFNLASLPAAASATITITVEPIRTVYRSFKNQARVTAAEPDPDLSNNQATTVTTLRRPLGRRVRR